MNIGDNNILDNLRREHGTRIMGVKDQTLLDEWKDIKNETD